MAEPMSDEDLSELHVPATYALNAGAPMVSVDPRHVVELIDEVRRLRAERESDPVRKLIAHPRFRRLERYGDGCDDWGAVVVDDDAVDSWRAVSESNTAELACAAALRALEAEGGSDGK